MNDEWSNNIKKLVPKFVIHLWYSVGFFTLKMFFQIPCNFLGIVSLSVFYAMLWPLVIFITCCLMYCYACVTEIYTTTREWHSLPYTVPKMLCHLQQSHGTCSNSTHSTSTCKSYVHVCVVCHRLSMDGSATSCSKLL
jgi:hypothetical protein